MRFPGDFIMHLPPPLGTVVVVVATPPSNRITCRTLGSQCHFPVVPQSSLATAYYILEDGGGGGGGGVAATTIVYIFQSFCSLLVVPTE